MPTPTPDITVYWRPGCPFCARLRRQLDRAGLPADWIDIWQDPRAAAGRMREVDRIMIDELDIDLVQMIENAGRNLADLAQRPYPHDRCRAGRGRRQRRHRRARRNRASAAAALLLQFCRSLPEQAAGDDELLELAHRSDLFRPSTIRPLFLRTSTRLHNSIVVLPSW